MEPSLRPREQMRSDLIGFLLYAIAEDPKQPEVNFEKAQKKELARGPWAGFCESRCK